MKRIKRGKMYIMNEFSNLKNTEADTSEYKRVIVSDRANKEDIIYFMNNLSEDESKRITKVLNKQNIINLSSNSFLVIKVFDKINPKSIHALFFYSTEGIKPIEKMQLPIPVSEFDFFGSLFLKVTH
jgi:hypothetical protein